MTQTLKLGNVSPGHELRKGGKDQKVMEFETNGQIESNKSHSLSRISIQAEGLVHSINMYLAYSSKCDIRPQDMDLGTRGRKVSDIEKRSNSVCKHF